MHRRGDLMLARTAPYIGLEHPLDCLHARGARIRADDVELVRDLSCLRMETADDRAAIDVPLASLIALERVVDHGIDRRFLLCGVETHPGTAAHRRSRMHQQNEADCETCRGRKKSW